MTDREEIQNRITANDARLLSIETLLKGIEGAEAPSSPIFRSVSVERHHLQDELQAAQLEGGKLNLRLAHEQLQEERRASKTSRREAVLATLMAVITEPYKAVLVTNEGGWQGPYVQLDTDKAVRVGRIEVELGHQERVNVQFGYGYGKDNARRYPIKASGAFNSKLMNAYLAERLEANERAAVVKAAKEDRRTFLKRIAAELNGQLYLDVITVPLADGGEIQLTPTTSVGEGDTFKFSVRETHHHGHQTVNEVRALLTGRTVPVVAIAEVETDAAMTERERNWESSNS